MNDPVRFLPPHGRETWPPVSDWTRDDWHCWLSQHDWTDAAIDEYLTVERYRFGFGVTTDHRLAEDRDLGDDSVQWLYLPTPKGVTLHRSRMSGQPPNTLWGGAAGGAKSYSARWEALTCLFRYEHFRAILMRRELNELQRTHLDKLEHEIQRINRAFGSERAKLKGSPPPCVTVADMDSKLFAGHCNNPGDEEKFLSEDYDLAIFDEATRLLRKQLIGVSGRVRNDPKVGRIGRTILTTNPGGPSHDYCVSHFIAKDVSPEENPKYDPADYTFIGAALFDNPYYVDPDGTFTSYEKRLYAYDLDRRRQLLNGDWTAVVGQFFAQFDSSRHVSAQIDIALATKIERWIVWGYHKPGYVVWAAILPNNRVYVFNEWLFRETLASDVAAGMRERSASMQRPITRTIGTANMWADEPTDESTADIFAANGVRVQRGSEDTARGWDRLRQWLKPATDLQPWLMVHPRCTYLTRTLPFLVSDPNNPDELPAHVATDQAAQALRIGVQARPTPQRQRVLAPTVLPHSVAAMVRKEFPLRHARPAGMVS